MVRRILIAAVLLVTVLLVAAPSRAMCTPGRIGVDPKEKKVTLEFPHCDPYP